MDGPAIKLGVETSEYAVAQESGWWSKALMILGTVGTVAGGIIEGIHQYQEAVPGTASNSTLALILMIVGIIGAVIGGVTKSLTASSYINGRSLVKAAAARDVPPPPQV